MADHPLFVHQLEAARRAKELEELEVTGGHLVRASYRRRPLPEDQIRPRATGRQTGLDLWAPSPLVTFDRNTTIHRLPTLLVTPVAKIAIPRGPHGETLADYPDPEVSVVEHLGYIERQERAAREPKNRDEQSELRERVARTPNDYDYVERGEARDVSDVGDVSYVCTNIDANPEVRKSFARAVYRHERLGTSKHKLLAGLEDLSWWTTLAAQPGAEAWVVEAARRLKAYERQTRAKGGKDREKRVVIAEVTERQAYDRIVWCQSQPGWDAKRKQVAFKSNIGGRVQYRFVFQLPYWISARERLEIVHKMARLMGKMGFMYVAAIHRPDPHNDARNYHVHIDAYDRPCKYNKKLKKWDIEIFEKKRNGSLKPMRQDKIAGFSRPAEKDVKHWEHWKGVLRNFREQFCAFTNEVLEKSPSGSPLRYHPGTFEDIGLNLRATKKLGGAMMAKEANGVRTPVGDGNALCIWGDVFDAIYRKRRERIDAIWERSRRTLARINKAADTSAKPELERDWAKLRKEELDLIERCFRFELAQAEIAMMKSRAETIIREAGRRGVGRDEGEAYRKSSLAPLRDVALREAEAHIALVDAFAPTKEAIATELRGQQDERARLSKAAKVLGGIILQSHHAPARSVGIERLSPTSIRLPVQPTGRHSTREGRYDRKEIERLLSWLNKHGGERERFVVADGKITITAKQAVCTLLAKHGAHPDISARLEDLAASYKAKEQVGSVNILKQAQRVLADRKKSPGNQILRPLALVPALSPVNVAEQQRFRQAEGLGLAISAAVPPIGSIKGPIEAISSQPEANPEAPERAPAPVLEEGTGEAAYLRQDREFIEEEVRARRQIESELLSMFRDLMTAKNPAFFQHLDEEGKAQLLSFSDPEAEEIVERRLREAANDDQVMRYIKRMLPTLPVASVDNELRIYQLVEQSLDLDNGTMEAFLERASDRGR
jgi:hypothetical protein